MSWNLTAIIAIGLSCTAEPASATSAWSELEHGLQIVDTNSQAPKRLDLIDAMRALKIPSLSVTLIERYGLAWAHTWGDATPQTLYQAASLSKTVTAVAALRLVQQGRLGLDRDVNTELASWRVPDSSLTAVHKVTLRGLLSMTGGIGVPGYLGYLPGSPLPNLRQILDGTPPANSPPVRVEYIPGSRYFYSGGGYEIVQALIEDATRQPFARAMQQLVLRPVGMTHSNFDQPLPPALVPNAATGHRANGRVLPGGWRVIPELAAGGMWSMPSDLARLLIAIARAWEGAANPLLDRWMAKMMLTKQNEGVDGLGGAVSGSGRDLVLMKRGQNIGYQAYMLIFPATGQGIVAMTGSDNGTTMITALIRRAATAYHWPALGALVD